MKITFKENLEKTIADPIYNAKMGLLFGSPIVLAYLVLAWEFSLKHFLSSAGIALGLAGMGFVYSLFYLFTKDATKFFTFECTDNEFIIKENNIPTLKKEKVSVQKFIYSRSKYGIELKIKHLQGNYAINFRYVHLSDVSRLRYFLLEQFGEEAIDFQI